MAAHYWTGSLENAQSHTCLAFTGTLLVRRLLYLRLVMPDDPDSGLLFDKCHIDYRPPSILREA